MASALPMPVNESPLFHLKIVDPQHKLADRTAIFTANLKAAVEDWNRAIPFAAALEIEVHVENGGVDRVDAASRSSQLLAKTENREVFEEGAAYKIRTGKSALPGQPDVLIRISPQWLDQEIWMDPHPETKLTAVPNHKLDMVSLLKHELAHAFGFHSFRDLKTGSLPKTYMSALDQLTINREGQFYFTGSHAEKLYGGPIPMTSKIESQNFAHYGNPGDAKSLVAGLMSGVTINYGRRYEISSLDLAILKDLGL